MSGSSGVRKGGEAPAIPVTPTPLPSSLPNSTPVPSQTPDDEIQSLEITPALEVIAINVTTSFKAFATYSISGRKEVTAQAAWKANKPAIGLLTGRGNFKGIAVGETAIVATLEGKTATATLRVFPGVTAQRVGVNFEDHPFSGDKDFNDSVLCFTGKVAVSAGAVISLENQTIAGVVTHISACDADMTISITGPGSYSWKRTFLSTQQPTYQMPFKAGSKLEVEFNPASNCGDNARTPVNMYNTDWARIQPNVCNTTGQ